MIATAIGVFLVLAVIAAMHAAWGFGMNWPAASRDDLFHLVVGTTYSNEMPNLAQCLVAAAAIFGAGVIALLIAGILKLPVSGMAVTAAGTLVMLVFAGRGIAAYTSVWRRHFSKEPFATMDRFWYGPLCLALAACFVYLLTRRVMS